MAARGISGIKHKFSIMTAQQDYNIAVASIIKIIVANNAGCVARTLRQAGYPTMDKIPHSELEATLFTVHSVNKYLFYEIMKRCEWNMGNNNWTNDVTYRDQLMSAVQQHTGMAVDKNNWWNSAINFLESQSKNFI